MSAPLAELQAWFLAAIMTPGGTGRGLALARERHGLDEADVLRPAPGAASARLHVHAEGYVLRLLDCLRTDYPMLCRLLGPELFDFFARAYVWRHPSRSPTLYDLGAGFADFLDATRQRAADADDALRLGFPAELARLERALGETARARGLEGAAPAPPGALDWLCGAEAEVALAPCTRLLALSCPLQAWWQEAAQAAPDAPLPPLPPAAPSWIAVTRQHYRNAIHALEPWQYHFLQAARDGAPVQACALQAARACGLAPGLVVGNALLWVPLAAGVGLVSIAVVPA